jgi:hypothetical protein
MPPDKRTGPQVTQPEARPNSSTLAGKAKASVTEALHAYWLAESDRNDMWQRRLLAAGRRGYACGRADGYAGGWAAAENDMAASWRAAVEPIAHPERGANRRLLAAIAGERRDQAEHERAFVARAYNTRADLRTDVQRAAVFCYPPPAPRKASAV